MSNPLRRWPVLAALFLALLAPGVRADDGPEEGVPDAVRRTAIKKLSRQLRKKARSPRAPKYREEILAMLESLEVLGGPEAGRAALQAVPLADAEVRTRAFDLADEFHDDDHVKPLAAMLEEKLYRDDKEVRARIARSLSIVGDPAGMPPLTALIRTDEIPEVVAAAADALATFSSAPLPLRKDAVKRLVDAYTTTWNLMMSVRPEDFVLGDKMKKQWKVYGRPIRDALQALTGQQELTRPQAWREWWNANKKRTDW